jgi:hypothetical protein
MTLLFLKQRFTGFVARICVRLDFIRVRLPGISSVANSLRKTVTAALMLFAGLSVAFAAEEFSLAERALFMSDHLASIRAPTTLQYTFRKSGTLEERFEDKVTVTMAAASKASCCTATTQFLGGPRRLKLPEIESPTGNPVILHFLERDIREMQRLTKGQPNYFRKRIRMAVFQGAKIDEVQVLYGGALVAAKQIEIVPYTDDPLRQRYEKFADKQYVFTLSPDVPGGVYAIRTRINGESSPLLLEEMTLDDSRAAPRTNSGSPTR